MPTSYKASDLARLASMMLRDMGLRQGPLRDAFWPVTLSGIDATPKQLGAYVLDMIRQGHSKLCDFIQREAKPGMSTARPALENLGFTEPGLTMSPATGKTVVQFLLTHCTCSHPESHEPGVIEEPDGVDLSALLENRRAVR